MRGLPSDLSEPHTAHPANACKRACLDATFSVAEEHSVDMHHKQGRYLENRASHVCAVCRRTCRSPTPRLPPTHANVLVLTRLSVWQKSTVLTCITSKDVIWRVVQVVFARSAVGPVGAPHRASRQRMQTCFVLTRLSVWQKSTVLTCITSKDVIWRIVQVVFARSAVGPVGAPHRASRQRMQTCLCLTRLSVWQKSTVLTCITSKDVIWRIVQVTFARSAVGPVGAPHRASRQRMQTCLS